jgi:polyphosphate kinase
MEYYINRELSWLDFNYRVLEEAYDKSSLLMDRFKFLAITASNLDEFFMVRIGGLKDQINVGYNKVTPDGMTPKEQLEAATEVCHEMMKKQYNCLNKSLMFEAEQQGLRFLKPEELNREQKEYVAHYFHEVCFPILTPQAIDKSRPFPLVSNNRLYLIILLEDKEGKSHHAIMQVPGNISRIISLPAVEGTTDYIFLEEIISFYIGEFFNGYSVKQVEPFRVTRNGDLAIDEDEAEDLLIEIEKSIKQRRFGVALKLEILTSMNKKTKKFLIKKLGIASDEVYILNGYLDLTVWMKFSFRPELIHLRTPNYLPVVSKDFFMQDNVFDVVREKDRLLHHPFQSFDTVVGFIRQAAADPKVLAIKQTLYRVSGDSPIIEALIKAAENGKQVTVLVELKARFDEENNIVWAKKLEKAGCNVIYGLVGLKIHCKMVLVVRQEEDGIKRYVHLGTGNYNDDTAKLYTDIGMFTVKENIASDVSSLFNVISGYSEHMLWKKLEVAPETLRDFFIRRIDYEIEAVKNGYEGIIVAKMNSLVDAQVISKLYEASQAGVEIKLVIRGICCLIPGVGGVSENITVQSIVGMFLEHSRIFYFYSRGKKNIYLSSADWMNRNLDRRIETLFPVEDPALKEEIFEILDITWKDTVKTRIMQSDGTYVRVDKRGKEILNSQEYFMEKAQTEFKILMDEAKAKLKEY